MNEKYSQTVLDNMVKNVQKVLIGHVKGLSLEDIYIECAKQKIFTVFDKYYSGKENVAYKNKESFESTVRMAIYVNSRDSSHFNDCKCEHKDLFKKVKKGTWKLRD